ncbi:ATPase, T2SS/T4P/T4SS family [Pseudomonas sp. DCB_CB]|uniref:GspE/PulE family protein n=1 Tax=unclassified Pseudomonas TaxID=196821 RepID=UPI002248F274|nr:MULTISPECIES: ATPase, T2SS/T4P/T4SS family [unclassified Pseudomonas]MCX2694509.1 ATPase, T2SS/T4P/T4SS family [Pseudomonas sp. DCB_BZ]MCX2859661.1 ATPase, T2SS/T4P/T4SS family [Pseudomonas sp. DCB_CB]
MNNFVSLVHCMSGPGCQYELNAEDREIMCLLSDGRLLISKSHISEHSVLEYMEVLQKAGVAYEVEQVNLQEVSASYTTHSASVAVSKSDSSRQKQVVEIIESAVATGASDLHFVPTDGGFYDIRFRVHGKLETFRQEKESDGVSILSCIYNSMCERQDKYFQENKSQDARMTKHFVEQYKLFGARISTRPSLYGPWMAVRLLYDNVGPVSLDQAGYTNLQMNQLKRLITETDGMVCLTGVTGSGKSTTLQTMLSMLIAATGQTQSVVTIEDPIEYKIPGAIQTMLPVGADTPEKISDAWAKSISNTMRLDPDVLMVGEMRDRASAVAAFQGVLTGHGLYTTLHTKDAISAIQRLKDLGVDANHLTDASMIKGLINQSLVRILCPDCKKPLVDNEGSIPADLVERVRKQCNYDSVFVAGEGCPTCNGRGVIRREVCAEIVLPTYTLMNKFFAGGKLDAKRHWIRELEGYSKNMHLIEKINSGLVDPFHGERDVCALDEDYRSLEA